MTIFIAGTMSRAITPRSLAAWGKCWASAIMQIHQNEFVIIKSGALPLGWSPQCRAFSMAVNNEKLLSLLFPLDGRAVVTNDLCIASHDDVCKRE